jgi:hypothetical protein
MAQNYRSSEPILRDVNAHCATLKKTMTYPRFELGTFGIADGVESW